MYDQTIKAENKIISYEDLSQIFDMMGEILNKYKKISENEKQQNSTLEYSDQNYTFKDENSKMQVVVNFYDNTNVTFDKYENFISVFHSRLDEIKTMNVYFSLIYSVVTPAPNRTNSYYHQRIDMYITENKLDITLDLKSDDPKLEDLYEFIKSKILNAPEKYDEIIKRKSKIINTVSFAIGMIPAFIFTTLLLLVPLLRNIILKMYVVYPLICSVLAFAIGSLVGTFKLDKLYKNIVPEKKSAGYDSNFNRIYKDDIESFVGTSDILIGNKVDNLKNREEIKAEYDKYRKFIPVELLVLFIASIIIILIGLAIN